MTAEFSSFDHNNRGSDAAPAGPHYEGHVTNKRRFSSIKDGLYRLVKKKLPNTPGAYNYAFEYLGLVEFAPGGRGIGARDMLQITHPNVYVNGQMVWTSGVGGVSHGQVITAPLYDPYNQAYGGGAT